MRQRAAARARAVARGALTVAIDTTVEERLRREGLAREIVRVVQAARREAGVAVTDRIELRLGGTETLLGAGARARALPRRRDARDAGGV